MKGVVCILVVLLTVLLYCEAQTISCRCTQVSANNTAFTISYSYTIPNINSTVSWVAAYSSSTASPCTSYIDSQTVIPGQSEISSQPVNTVSVGTYYYCFLFAGTVNNCSVPDTGAFQFMCYNPYTPQPPFGSPVTLLGPITFSNLGIGLGIGVLLFFLCLCIIAFVVYKKKQQDKDKEVA